MPKVVCNNSIGNSAEFDTSELSFRPSIYGVIIQHGKVLLVPQWDGYDFPGGGVDMAEPILDALKREVKEETGFDVEVDELLYVGDHLFLHPKSNKGFHAIVIYYACHVVGGSLSDEGFDEHEQEYARLAEWVDLDRIDTLKHHNSIDAVSLIHRAEKLLKNT